MVGNNILCRGIDEEGHFATKEPFTPTLFVNSKKETKWKTLTGICVEPIQPGTINDCREFVNQYSDVAGFDIYGNTDYIYQYISQNSEKEIDYDFSDILVAYIDIETESENGFPNIETANEKINAITVRYNDKTYVYGLGEFKLPARDNLEQFCYDDEELMLSDFLSKWKENYPDVITGWNVRFFDIPYIVNRLARLFGENVAKEISPWRRLKARKITTRHGEQNAYNVLGISTLDYLDLYRTFTYVNQESYSLEHISYVELGESKLSHDEYSTFSEFYKNDFQKFIEYNERDVELIVKLEDKMKLLELAIALAYSAKVNYEDVFSQVRTWDAIIYHYLNEHDIVIPPKKAGSKSEQYAGAYVKEPIVGMHDWVVSFDLNSLYPHLIMQYNISPETMVSNNKDSSISPDSILDGKFVPHDAYSVAANGTCYTKEHQGFLPSLMEKMYKERKMYKNKMIEAQKLQQDIPKMNMPNLGRHALNEKCKKDIAKYNNFQLVRKIQLNSAYGAIGNQYFRYYNVDMAEAITLSGQLSIRWIADKLNVFLNKTVGTKDYDYVVASDTDSVYLRLGNLVEKVCGGRTKSQVVEFLNKASEEIILPFIKKQYDELACKMNAYDNKMVMDRECIADKGVWTAKKRYMMNVYDSEGIRYETPKMKIMGIETTRSSTPQIVREKLKEVIKLILTKDNESVIEYIDGFKKEFKNYSPAEIAFPRSCNGLKKYKDPSLIYKKSTPIAVKGSLIYNNLISIHGLQRKYQNITDGEKVKFLYLKEPNPIGERVISFQQTIPQEFDLNGFVDYDLQFQKTFLDPLNTILEKIDWQSEKISTLEDLFI